MQRHFFTTPTFPASAVPAAQAVPEDGPAGGVQALLEDQRRALAREIHDDIGSALGAAHFDLAWVARHPGHADAAAHVASAHEALRQAMAATQRVVQDLYPPDLSEGVVPALRALARGFERRHGTPVAFEAPPDFDVALPAAARLAACRTVQEALANVARHARAGAVSVRCGRDAASAWLEVRDDGRGFDAGAARRPRGGDDEQDDDPCGAGGFGLRGLAERARGVGGHLEVDGRLGRGTAVRLTVPAPSRAGMNGGGEDNEDNDDEAQGVDGRPG